MKPDKIIQAAEVLDVLVKKLPDEVLQQYLKDLPPKQIRKILKEVIGIIAPKRKKASPSTSQVPLWGGIEKTWEGKLAGRALQLFTDGASRG